MLEMGIVTHRIATVGAVLLMVVNGGCLGDRVLVRDLHIHQMQSTGVAPGPFIVDVSQLPPHSVEVRQDTMDGTGSPATSLTIQSKIAVKILLVPATQP